MYKLYEIENTVSNIILDKIKTCVNFRYVSKQHDVFNMYLCCNAVIDFVAVRQSGVLKNKLHYTIRF